ncbi:MAG: DUF3108 domain-containing protein [Bacteroidota bacterium]
MKNNGIYQRAAGIICLALMLFTSGGLMQNYGAPYKIPSHVLPTDSLPGKYSPCDSFLICPGEDLLYEVSYAGIKLGRIRLTTFPTDTINGETRYHATGFVDSYEGIPFVDIHVIDSTDMNTSYYSEGFHAFENTDDGWIEESSHYDLDRHTILIEKLFRKELHSPSLADPKYDTVKNVDFDILDGLSMLYFARAHVRGGGRMNVSTVVYGKQGKTELIFTEERKLEEIDVLKQKKIRVVGLKGTAHFRGLYGMTGDFRGWFTDDVAAVPVKAELGLVIGNVNIELIWWRRHHWQLPLMPKK